MPREVYIFGIIVFYAVSFFLYAGYGVSMDKYNSCTECLENPSYSGYTNPIIPDDTNNLLGYVHSGFSNMPDWANIVYVIYSAMIILLIVMLVIHG